MWKGEWSEEYNKEIIISVFEKRKKDRGARYDNMYNANNFQ